MQEICYRDSGEVLERRKLRRPRFKSAQYGGPIGYSFFWRMRAMTSVTIGSTLSAGRVKESLSVTI